MTSNRYFFKMQKELLKRNIVLPVLSGVGFFFCLPLAMLMVLQQRLADTYYAADSENIYKIVSAAAYRMLSNQHFGVGLGMVIMATLSGILLFRYLHNRKQVDFYHALPISRKKLFAYLYVTGILAVIPLYILMYVIALVVAFVMHGGQMITITLVAQTLFTNILFFFLFYSLAVLATILTGNTVIAVGVYGLFHLMLPVTFFMMDLLCREWFLTYAGSQCLQNLFQYTFPLLLYFQNTLFGMKIYENAPSISLSIGIFIVIALLILLSALLFVKRKSERAGSALAFYKMKSPLKCYLVFIIGYVVMLAFGGIAGAFWKFPGLFLGVIFAHIVIEILYHMEMRAAFANWKTMLGLLVVSVLVSVGMKEDMIGYDQKIPKLEEIKSVSIVDSYFGNVNMRTIKPLTKEHNIELVREMAQYGVEHLQPDTTMSTTSSVVSTNNSEMVYYTISYTLENGSKMKRQYNVMSSEELFALAESLRFDKEYRKVQANTAYDIELDNIHSVGMSIYNPAGDETGLTNVLENVGQVKEILTMLREESLTLTKEQARTEAPVFYIDVDARYYWQEAEGTYNQYLPNLPIYESYTKTVELIEKYTGITPKRFSVDDVKRVDLTIYADSGQENMTDEEYETYLKLTENITDTIGTSVEDVEVINRLLEDAVPMELQPSCDPLMNIVAPFPIDVCVILENDSIISISYKDANVPFLEIFAQFAG